MKLTPEELTAHGYTLLNDLNHKELVPFIRTYLKKRTSISLFFNGCNILILIWIIGWIWLNHRNGAASVRQGFTYISFGFAIAFALIPLHEWIHALAYKSQGAKKTSYDANLKKFYFMAVADQFVANKKEFQIVALAPFAVITFIMIILFFIVPILWTYTILGALLTHTSFSSGDFGLLSYFESHPDKEIVTYDDKENMISFFYGRPKYSVHSIPTQIHSV